MSSKDAFSLMADGHNPDSKVRIVEAILFARKTVLSPTVQMAHIKALAKGTAKYGRPGMVVTLFTLLMFSEI